MTRREFPTSVRVAVIKRATVRNVIMCEKCGHMAKRFQIDHIIADAHGGEPILSNAMLICAVCYGEKNPRDTKIAAKLKRVEAKNLGATKPKGRPLQSRGFERVEKPKREAKKTLKPLNIYGGE